MEGHTQRERLIWHIREVYGVEAEHLWADLPDCAVFRHGASRKWFGIVMNVPRKMLGLGGEGAVDVLNVKCGPILAGSLRTEPGFLPAYHMNKSHWISVQLDGPVPDEQIVPLLSLSYDAVAPKRRRKKPAGDTAGDGGG